MPTADSQASLNKLSTPTERNQLPCELFYDSLATVTTRRPRRLHEDELRAAAALDAPFSERAQAALDDLKTHREDDPDD